MSNPLPISEFLHGGDYNPDQWLDRPDIIDQDFKYFDEAHINSVSLGIFSWAQLEPAEGQYNFTWLDEMFDRAEKQHINVVLATPSGTRPRWLAEKYPEVLRVAANGQRNHFGERHNHCYTSPIYREKTQAINRLLAKRYGKRANLVLWHISNEYSGACYCDLCQAAFRDWLKAKYQTLDALNHAYWNGFWAHAYTTWDQVAAPMPNGDMNVLGLNLDWKRFVSDQTIDFFDNEIKPLRELTPNIPVTTNLMGGNPPTSDVFFDLDYQKFAQHLDIVSWDSYPNWGNDYESTAKLGMKTALMNDSMRSLKHANYLIMENTPSQVNWHQFNHAKRPGMHAMASLQEVAHGADSVMYFQLHQSRGASEMFHGAVITHQLSDQTRVFKDVTQVGHILQQLQAAHATNYVAAKVAIVFDYDNLWALDDARNYAQTTKKYWTTIQTHYQYFWEHNIPVDLVSTADDLTAYDLVIDPMHFMMSPTFAAKLKAYVEQGGHLVGTYITGVVDRNYLAYLGGGIPDLTATYGIKVAETDTLYPKQHNQLRADTYQKYAVNDYAEIIDLAGAESLATYTEDFYAGSPALTQNTVGAGTAYYMAARGEQAFLADFYQQLDEKLKLSPTLPIKTLGTPVSIQVREDSQAKYYFVINFSHEPQTLTLATELTDVLANNHPVSGQQSLAAYGVRIFSNLK
ncbi:beta-galactosidase [Lactiplantibacillus fabifermentans]|uniref:Beta-galactosidase n=2 Tax=Lactiplantibacillus fabifermentans TaxID=483011 RepID=A0A0R2NMY9_9LACO|nr:beta-galactosidase [Lactiplantibacillus fabifermentans]ETY75332.1 beta-galactosidase [Lactiplantibacillus fabifermentans T30PCM01]KRO27121.1 beta-galactosidase i [Lactiplantibacillus fabifermentans DSM 21115]